MNIVCRSSQSRMSHVGNDSYFVNTICNMRSSLYIAYCWCTKYDYCPLIISPHPTSSNVLIRYIIQHVFIIYLVAVLSVSLPNEYNAARFLRNLLSVLVLSTSRCGRESRAKRHISCASAVFRDRRPWRVRVEFSSVLFLLLLLPRGATTIGIYLRAFVGSIQDTKPSNGFVLWHSVRLRKRAKTNYRVQLTDCAWTPTVIGSSWCWPERPNGCWLRPQCWWW